MATAAEYHLLQAGDEPEFLAAVDRVGPTKLRLGGYRSYLRDLEHALAMRRRSAGLEPERYTLDLARTLNDRATAAGPLLAVLPQGPASRERGHRTHGAPAGCGDTPPLSP